MEQLTTIEELLNYIKVTFPDKTYIYNNINDLINLFNEDNNTYLKLNISSLKSLIRFLNKLKYTKNFREPTLNLVCDEDKDDIYVYFYIKWELNLNNLTTIRFKENYYLDYIIYKSSNYYDVPHMILDGNMYTLDFIEYISTLNLSYIYE